MPNVLLPRIPGAGGLTDPANTTTPTVTPKKTVGSPPVQRTSTPPTAPPPDLPPVGEPVTVPPAGPDTLTSLRAEDLRNAIAAIEARFGLTEEQLLADQTQIGQAWRMLKLELAKAEATEQRQIEGSFAARGGLRSGLRVRAEQEAAAKFLQMRQRRDVERAEALAAIQRSLAMLDAQQAQEIAAEEARFADLELSDAERRALAAGA